MRSGLYFIAILPPDDVAEKIRLVQHEIADRFGPRRALLIPVHITLESPFRYPAESKANLEQMLGEFFSGKKPFELELRNFGTFRQDVIFIEVSPSLPLLELHLALSNYLRSEKHIVGKPSWHGGYTPHLTVANRDVTPQDHQLIWKEFNTRKFYAKFSVSAVCLLEHDETSWQVCRRYPLH